MNQLGDLNPYKMTIIGAIVVLAMSYAALVALGGAQNAAPYLTLIGSVAIPALLALLRSDQAAQQSKVTQLQSKVTQGKAEEAIAGHHETQQLLLQLKNTLEARGETIDEIHEAVTGDAAPDAH